MDCVPGQFCQTDRARRDKRFVPRTFERADGLAHRQNRRLLDEVFRSSARIEAELPACGNRPPRLRRSVGPEHPIKNALLDPWPVCEEVILDLGNEDEIAKALHRPALGINIPRPTRTVGGVRCDVLDREHFVIQPLGAT